MNSGKNNITTINIYRGGVKFFETRTFMGKISFHQTCKLRVSDAVGWRGSQDFCKIQRKAPVPKSLYNKVERLAYKFI